LCEIYTIGEKEGTTSRRDGAFGEKQKVSFGVSRE